jgi:histidine ammonia-lyase
LSNFLENQPTIFLSNKAKEKILKARSVVDEVAKGETPVYGINTGFGKLATKIVAPQELNKLQKNLIRSHSVGTGRELSKEEIRVALLLLINSLSKGYSGIRLKTLEKLIQLINSQFTPVIYEYGSLGASGDLVPLAHIVLTLFDENPVRDNNGELHDSLSIVNSDLIIDKLEAKEGLALINGTHFTTALTAVNLIKFIQLVTQSYLSFCLAVDALQASTSPFQKEIHSIRPHPGQIWTGNLINEILSNSDIAQTHVDPLKDPRVQDPYSFRCFPQVMGGIIHTLTHSTEVINIELNCVTDNPIITPNKEILSGGNFHAEPVALIADYLGIAVAKLMDIMEKQGEKLLNPATNYNIPAFLTPNPGLNSGFMIGHYTMASLLNRVRLLSHPSSVDNVSVSANQEDHVSMGMNAALKFKESTQLFKDFLALHFMITAQGLTLRKELTKKASSPINERILTTIREIVPFLTEDRPLYSDLKKMKNLINSQVLYKNHGCLLLDQLKTWLLTGKKAI